MSNKCGIISTDATVTVPLRLTYLKPSGTPHLLAACSLVDECVHDGKKHFLTNKSLTSLNVQILCWYIKSSVFSY